MVRLTVWDSAFQSTQQRSEYDVSAEGNDSDSSWDLVDYLDLVCRLRDTDANPDGATNDTCPHDPCANDTSTDLTYSYSAYVHAHRHTHTDSFAYRDAHPDGDAHSIADYYSITDSASASGGSTWGRLLGSKHGWHRSQ